MTDTKNDDDKTLTAPKKTLSLKGRVETGSTRQSFSHGRTKVVVVEKVKRRGEGEASPSAPAARVELTPRRDAAPARPAPAAPSAPAAPPQVQRRPGGVVLRSLNEDELDARAQALANARVREVEERRQAEEDQRRRAAEEVARKAAEEEAARKAAAEEARRAAEPEVPEPVEEAPAPVAEAPAAKPATPAPAAAPKPAAPTVLGRRPIVADEDEERRGGPAKKGARPAEPAKPVKRIGEDRRQGRLTIAAATTDQDNERSRSLAALRRRREKEKRGSHSGPREKVLREVVLPEAITVQELANRMAERAVDVIRLLMRQGQMVKINDVIDADTAELIATEMGHTVKRVSESDVEEGLFNATADVDDDAVSRPPVVTIMGHVDHGKTSLLDAIRHANVVSGEAGGITQHIGAYQVEQDGQKITFIDTPGHAAFTAMRARGAKATDIVILVVAADDGVMPQTIEAIAHAKAADVPIIVAINKIDKPDAKAERVRTELLRHEIVVESMGGDVQEVEVSATKKINLDKLLEAILLQSEVLELKASVDRPAEGLVVEAKLDKGRGPVASVLVQRGTLKIGDILIAGGEWGRVRAILDDKGNQLTEAGPSMPVEVLGLQAAPEAGDRIAVVENDARAREVTEYRQRQKREKSQARLAGARGSLEQMMSDLKSSAGRKEFPLVIKADVQGSLEAIIGALEKLGTDEVSARILHAAVGGITESDVTLAGASDAAIIGFNVRANKQARDAAEQGGTEIRYYNIIYNLVDDVKAAMSGLLSPERRETFLGNATILEIFNITKVGKIAGCRVTEGHVERGASVRLIRDNVVVHEGKLGTLKRFKDEVKEVQVGQECGMNFENYQDMRPGDVIECFRVEEIARSL
jgi:translation initiation factor IF-2